MNKLVSTALAVARRGAPAAPKTRIEAAEFRSVLFDTRIMKKLGALAKGWPNAANAIDGDPNTFALLTGSAGAPRPQAALSIAFPEAVPFDGLVLMARQNHRDHEGDVRELSVPASTATRPAWRTGVPGRTAGPEGSEYAAPRLDDPVTDRLFSPDFRDAPAKRSSV
ncbi:hypothetical protein [Massilia sp. BSC265]|uniref:hypothetical protein n=1 Tax=Massilia sp. BSC265 TaxID=1549812 RepID=UPI0004E95B05|nr:hypothetical protein [Massilia sp. BSC265]KFI05656.1 hypothetical protein JN27_19490 [Massilia sp. BSC265]